MCSEIQWAVKWMIVTITPYLDVDRFHFDDSSFPPAVVQQQVSLEVDNKPLKFILPFWSLVSQVHA